VHPSLQLSQLNFVKRSDLDFVLVLLNAVWRGLYSDSDSDFCLDDFYDMSLSFCRGVYCCV
jgi:hypothetical protein